MKRMEFLQLKKLWRNACEGDAYRFTLLARVFEKGKTMFGFLRKLFGGSTNHQPTPNRRDPDRIQRLRGDGDFTVKAAGTSNYQDALQEIQDGFRKNQNPDFLIEVVPQPDNPHDSSALKLMRDGSLLGYIPADVTSEIHGALRRAGQDGQTCKVLARLVGHREKSPGLRLNMQRPARF